MPIRRVLPMPLSVIVSPSLTWVTTAACARFGRGKPARRVRGAAVSVDGDAAHPPTAMTATSAATRLVVAAEAIPAIQLNGFGGQSRLTLLREPGNDGVDDGVAGGLF